MSSIITAFFSQHNVTHQSPRGEDLFLLLGFLLLHTSALNRLDWKGFSFDFCGCRHIACRGDRGRGVGAFTVLHLPHKSKVQSFESVEVDGGIRLKFETLDITGSQAACQIVLFFWYEERRKGLTVVLSVIFKTSFASDDFHFTQYRVCVGPDEREREMVRVVN